MRREKDKNEECRLTLLNGLNVEPFADVIGEAIEALLCERITSEVSSREGDEREGR